MNFNQSACTLIILYVFFFPKSAIAAEISSFVFYEQPEQRLVLDGVSVKYKVAAAGLDARWSNNLGELAIRVGVGYNPNESATYSGIKMSGPVQATYVSGEISTHPYDLYIASPVLSLKTEYFDFHSNDLTGAYGNDNVTGTVAGTLINASVSGRVEYTVAEKNSFGLEAGYDIWQYQFDSEGVILRPNLTARSRKTAKATSIDPFISFKLATEIFGFPLQGFYKVKKLSNVSSTKVERIGLSLQLKF
jgi:hypothetical protein